MPRQRSQHLKFKLILVRIVLPFGGNAVTFEGGVAEKSRGVSYLFSRRRTSRMQA
jgi:hypothetical protein